jgi:adenine-specific DNA-methyltransferase
MKNIIEENEKITVNTKEIEILKKHFPNCFNKDGEFQMDKFEKRISQEVDVTKEGYELRWLGKNYARLLANIETDTMIVDDKEHNDKVENKNSENIYIEGDNIDVLKHLKNAYSEKIKMIYIDPPYNTGSDGFVYKDDRKYTKEDLAELTNITEEEAQRILSFNTKGSNSHSAWLTFMYPRLLTARELLSDDGVIFISIDDNEVSQLKLLCDEVFGEENFVAELPRITKKSGKTTGQIAKNNDYIMIYRSFKNIKIKGNILEDEKYCNKDEYFDERGYYKVSQTLDYNSISYSSSLDYEIEIDGKIFIPGGVDKSSQNERKKANPKNDFCWRWSKKLFKYGLEKGFVVIKGNRIYTKTYKNAVIEKNGDNYKVKQIDKLKALTSLEFIQNKYSNDNSKKNIESIFGRNIFNYSKPLILIEKIITIIDDPNSLILDFFSGSATTAHAVMQLNAEDGGNRKFIMVQIPEEIDPKKSKAAYDFCVDELKQEPVITTIGKERIKRAANKIKKENKSKLEEKPLDLGFKLFKTKSIPEKYIERMKDENNELLVTKMLSKEELQALLITWKTYDGYPLTKELKTVQFGKYNSYVVDRILYLVNTDFNLENLLEFIKKLDSDGDFVINKIVIFGYHFNSDILLTIKDMVTTYRNKKSIELDVEVRY